jgi:alkanesulfonate monooxygenase SsuD/methylene tetrahydromethanopterin reductase-like flavin-dependent oxidoreductase (luciferase family)
MKLGITGGVAPGGDWQQALRTVRLADELGYDSCWLGETWAHELFASLSQMAGVTERIKLGAGIANVFSRSAATIAMGAATIDEQSGGRFILGLGSSGPIVVERLHGVPFEKPLTRIKEYVEIITTLIAGEKLHHRGEIFTLDQGFGLRMNPIRPHIPIYIASLTPRSLKQSGEIADGVLPIYWPGAKFAEMRATLDEASIAAGRESGSTRIAPYITTVLVEDESERATMRRRARGPIAFYIGRMGNFYAEMLERHGYVEEVAAVRAGWKQGHDAAAAGVSDEMLDATALVGTADEIAAKLESWVASGLDEPVLSFAGADGDKIERTLRALAPLNGN